jgi:asparagine synthetase B (glutamine-hydrolysing)
MALNGALLDTHTYWRGVQLLGPAQCVTLRDGRCAATRYWHRRFSYADRPAPPTAADFAARVTQALRAHLGRFERPVLALSGGLDSRLLLAAAARADLDLPCITWGFDHVEAADSDVDVALAAARRAGRRTRVREVRVDELPTHAARVVELTDGMCGHLGNFTEGEAVARELGERHDALLRGDEMFGWAARVDSPALALRRVGVNVGKRLRLLRFLLQRDVAREVLADYRAQQDALVGSGAPQRCADDLKDILYWRTRFPRLIASQAAVFRPQLEVVCPLLSGTVLDWTHQLAPAERCDKQRARQCVAEAYPEQFALPLNRVHSRTSWRRRLRELGVTQRFLVETLLDPQPAFDAWFDRTAIRAWLGQATAEGAQQPWPGGVGLLARSRARFVAFLLRPTFKERVVLNLVTLKLWLASQYR